MQLSSFFVHLTFSLETIARCSHVFTCTHANILIK